MKNLKLFRPVHLNCGGHFHSQLQPIVNVCCGFVPQSRMVEDIKALFKVLFMFLPLPVFWTLFDQQVKIIDNFDKF